MSAIAHYAELVRAGRLRPAEAAALAASRVVPLGGIPRPRHGDELATEQESELDRATRRAPLREARPWKAGL